MADCRTHTLLLKPACRLNSLVSIIKSGTPALVATQGGRPLHAVLKSAMMTNPARSEEAQKPCILLVGPEGDFTNEELDSLLAAGAEAVGLGPNRLRVETAAIALVAGVMLQTEGWE